MYWALQSLHDEQENNKVQHTGLWRKLLEFAEKFSKEKKYAKLSIISWVGVREYYRKNWYHLEWTYMSKDL